MLVLCVVRCCVMFCCFCLQFVVVLDLFGDGCSGVRCFSVCCLLFLLMLFLCVCRLQFVIRLSWLFVLFIGLLVCCFFAVCCLSCFCEFV